MSGTNPITLETGSWYAWQMLPGYFDGFSPYYSPILVVAAKPEKSGRGWLKLEFVNAFYASGVQDFSLRMKVLSRKPNYLIASLDYPDPDTRDVVIGRMSFDWLERHHPEWLRSQDPKRLEGSLKYSVERYLEMRLFGKEYPLRKDRE